MWYRDALGAGIMDYIESPLPLATEIQTVNGILGLTHFRNRPRGEIAVGSR